MDFYNRMDCSCSGFVLVGFVVGFVKGHPSSVVNPNAPMEGVVGRPAVEIKNREGERVIVKIKVKDFE